MLAKLFLLADFSSNRKPSRDRISAALKLGGWLLVLLGIAGCGVDTYEQRLEQTRQFYAYLEKLDQNLASAWRSPPIDALRVPRGFQEIPAPQPTKGPDGELELPPDLRQPDYVNLSIKGLIGAWKGQVDVGAGDQRGAGTAYLYAATNYGMFLTEEAIDASGYTEQLLTDMEAYLQTPAVKQKEPLTLPKGNQFAARQTFDVAFLRPDLPINETRYIFEVYSQRQADNQVVLIFARPEGMDPQSRIPERIQMMLESMRVSAERPQAKEPGKSGPTAPGPAINF